jgi:phosphate transport system substrate-binding protein
MTRWLVATTLAVAIAGCGGGESNSQVAPASESAAAPASSTANDSMAPVSSADLTGAGSTFAYPLYSRWVYEYAQKTGVHVNYQAVGSGAGIRQFSDEIVDFGGTDAPMNDDQLAKAKGGAVLQVPTALGAEAITYNLTGVSQIRLDGPTLADIYLGKITKWNAPEITKLNPGVKLPSTDILVVHRSDGSGTTFIFTDYLTRVSPAWNSGPGKGTDINWPVGLGGKGNAGVAGQVKQTPGAIGYVELAYATQNNLPYALLKNKAGVFLPPSLEGATAAAAGVAAGLPANTDFRVSVVNAPGKDAYPISSFTWMLVYTTQPDARKGKALVDFVRWGIHDGQQFCKALQYAPLPDNIVKMLDARLDAIKIGSAS